MIQHLKNALIWIRNFLFARSVLETRTQDVAEVAASGSETVGQSEDAHISVYSLPAVTDAEPVREPPSQPEPRPVVLCEAAKPRVKRKPAVTLGALLDSLEAAFESVSLHPTEYKMTDRDTRTGLRRMGPHVANTEAPMMEAERVEVTEGTHWSALLFVSIAHYNPDKEAVENGIGHADFYYARKFSKLPWYVEQKPGIGYEFGMAYRFGSKLQWIYQYIVVNPKSGEVDLCKCLLLDRVQLKPVGLDVYYTRKRWGCPATESATAWSESLRERERIACRSFSSVFNWWQKRANRWSVSVRRAGDRVTFSVEMERTKNYFKDRDKTIVARDGKAKRIIHHVSAHERILKDGKTSPVKEHIRGIREFDWKGYHCAVTAPKFHMFNLVEFNVGAEDDEGLPRQEKMIGFAQLGKQLADLEDRQAA